MRCLRGPAIAAAAVALVAADLALAGTFDPAPGDNVLGKEGGFKYVRDGAPFNPGNNGFAFDAIACGSDWHVLGGGVELGGPASSKSFSESLPRDIPGIAGGDANESPDDAWSGGGRGPDGERLNVYGVCGRDDGVRYEFKTVGDDDSGNRVARVSCDSDWHVSGGGALISPSGSWITSSRPFDGSDRGTRRDDGWSVAAFDPLDGVGGFFIAAVCTKDSLSYEKDRAKDVVAGDGDRAIARCASGRHVVGGGVEVSGPPNRARATGSHPIDEGDDGAVPDDGWRASAYNVSGLAKDVTAYAVCAE